MSQPPSPSVNDRLQAQAIGAQSLAFRALLDRLECTGRLRRTTADELEALLREHPSVAVLFTDEPHRCPESWDVTVIFPDVLRAAHSAPLGVVLPPDESRIAARRHDVDRYPSVIVFRGGVRRGAIEGMQDWDVFPDALDRLCEPAAH